MRAAYDAAFRIVTQHFAKHPNSRPYIGITADPERRIAEHKREKGYRQQTRLATGLLGNEASVIETALIRHFGNRLTNGREGTNATHPFKPYVLYMLHH